ncbi:MAG: hypothetical protein ACXWK8_00605 [Myxococcaceae bacterium]
MNRGLFGRIPGAGSRWATLALLSTLWAPLAAAQTVDASSTTLLRLQPVWTAGTTQTGFWGTELVGLTVKGFDISGVDDFNIKLSAWAQLASLQNSIYTGSTGDIDFLYVQGALFKRHLILTVGRQIISGGAARVMQLDGLNATAMISRSFGISGYVGAPTPSRFGYQYGNFAFGGRAFWRPVYGSEIGFSYLEVLNNGYIARQDMGLDGQYAILRNLSVTASGILALGEGRWSDAAAGIRWRVIPDVELFATAEMTSPDLYLPRTSIFSVFSDAQRDGLGGGAFWQALPRLGLYGEYQHLWVEGGNGDQAEVRVTYKFAPRSTVGASWKLLYIPSNGANEVRAWVVTPVSQSVKLSGDVDWVRFQNPINAYQTSLLATASANWLFAPGWTGMLSGSVGTTPFYQTAFSVTARIAYLFSNYDGKAHR